jgi:hypothetical protein
MSRHEFELFADYFQFYLQDEDERIGIGDLSDAWTKEAAERLLAVAPGVVGIGTARNMTVPVVIEVLDHEPEADFDEWEHVVEGGLELKSGRLVVAGCTDYFPDAARLPVAAGTYRVRMSCRGFETISTNGLDGDDTYRVQLWAVERLEPPALRKQAKSPR